MRTLFHAVAVMALVFFLGLHWAFLQSVAWTGMIFNYSRGASWSVAVQKTFDGQHPCLLCKAVKQGRAEERKQERRQVKPESKLEFAVVWEPVEFEFLPPKAGIPSTDLFAPSRAFQPPKPRPKGLC